MKPKKLTATQGDFVAEYLRNGRNLASAFRFAYNCDGLTNAKVHERARTLMQNPVIELAILQATQKVVDSAVIDATFVMREWGLVATGDANDIIQHRRLCCRYCHGRRHLYYWKDKEEFEQAQADATDSHSMATERALALKQPPPPLKMPDDLGGYGFRFNATPHPDCPKCLGEGYGDVFIADTRYMSESAKRLYAGIKKTKDGIEIKMHDRMQALEKIAKVIGMLKEGSVIIPNGAGGYPALPDDSQIPNNAQDACALYRDLMGKGKP